MYEFELRTQYKHPSNYNVLAMETCIKSLCTRRSKIILIRRDWFLSYDLIGKNKQQLALLSWKLFDR